MTWAHICNIWSRYHTILSVIRAHVSFVLGRSGPYLTILDMMETAVVKRWNGSLRVKSSCMDILQSCKCERVKSIQAPSFRKPTRPPRVIPHRHPKCQETSISQCPWSPNALDMAMLNEELTATEKPKSVRRALPSSDIKTLACITIMSNRCYLLKGN